MSKLQFKSMLKECLSELINEGAFDSKIEQITESKMRNGGVLVEAGGKRSAENLNPSLTPHMAQAIKNLSEGSSAFGNKSMFAEMLLDTAQNTLQEQLRGERGSKGFDPSLLIEGEGISTEEMIQDENQLSMLAGGDISRWAKSAFGKK